MLNIQHRLNPLHVYCRLVEKGLNKRLSICICKYYEVLVYSWLVWLTIIGIEISSLSRPAS